MPLKRYMDNRHFHHGRKGTRGIYRVPYTWAGWGAQPGAGWGYTADHRHYTPHYAHRSAFAKSDVSVPEWGIEAMNKEPYMSVDMELWKPLSRKVLTRGNTKRNVLMWSHPRTGGHAWWKYKFPGLIGIPKGFYNGEGLGECPAPMSTDALWKISYNETETIDEDLSVTAFNTSLYDKPDDIQAEMQWSPVFVGSSTRNGSMFVRCHRIVCFLNCYHQNGDIQLTERKYCTMRKSTKPSLLGFCDTRFHPYGWTDYVKAVGVPMGIGEFGDKLLYDFNYHISDSVMDGSGAGEVPESPGGAFVKVPFTSHDVFNLSFAKLSSGLKYASQPWHVSDSVGNGLDYLENDRPFDLVLEIEVCYLREEQLINDVWVEIDPRFAGLYGTAYAIY